MEDFLIRTISTGRTGTKFVSAIFSDQGYRAFHEDLYEGEPGSAIIHYTRMLGDKWISDKERYYSLESDFARPYIDAVLECLRPKRDSSKSSDLRKWMDRSLFAKEEKLASHVIVHTGHRLTPATPLIENEAENQKLLVKTLILYRNPLKTIHALYTVESAPSGAMGPYRNRPSLFFDASPVLAAAQIWANTYKMCLDLSEHSKFGPYLLLNLDRFDHDLPYTEKIFESLQLNFDTERFTNFVQMTLSQPLRASKVKSIRNSHIFHDPNYYFSTDEINQIYSLIKSELIPYGLDWDEVVVDYRNFHEIEKHQIGLG